MKSLMIERNLVENMLIEAFMWKSLHITYTNWFISLNTHVYLGSQQKRKVRTAILVWVDLRKGRWLRPIRFCPITLVILKYHICRWHKLYKNWTTVEYFFTSKIGHFSQLLFDQDIVAPSLWQKAPVNPKWTLDLL